MQVNNNNIHENSKRYDHDYQVKNKDYKLADKVIPVNYTAFKYENPYKDPFKIIQCWTNGTISLQCGEIKIRYNIHHIKTYESDTNVEDINIEKYA